MRNKHRGTTDLLIEYLRLIDGGIHVRTNLMSFMCINWIKSMLIYGELLRLGYIMVAGNEVFLTDRGRRLLGDLDKYLDLFKKRLYIG